MLSIIVYNYPIDNMDLHQMDLDQRKKNQDKSKGKLHYYFFVSSVAKQNHDNDFYHFTLL